MKFVIKNLEKSFKQQAVLKGIDFEFEVGKIYCLLGRNGAGKTTLFNCLNSNLIANKGETYFENQGNISDVKYGDINYVLSEPNLPLFLTGYEFLDFFLEFNKDKIKREPIEKYFDLIQFKPEDYNKLIKEYSLGMKNKLQMLANILIKPKLLLLDEPLASFDIVAVEEMKELLKNLKKDVIIIISTHLLDLAYDLADQIMILNDGKITNSFNTKEVEYQHLKSTVLEFLKDPNEL